MPKIEYRNVTLKYKDTVALDGIDIDIEENKINGLLGRNGAGKTSMLSLLASFRKPAEGTITIGGSNPFEDPALMEKVFMVWSNQILFDSSTVEATLRFCSEFRPEFDMEYALKLIDMFGLEPGKKVRRLSQGMKSSLNVICGMAARAPITIFDETYLGMDAANRKLFYKELLDDYMEQPRTIIISTHYIQEVESLFEDIIILDKGKVVLQDSAENVKTRAITVVGDVYVIHELEKEYEVINSQILGKTRSLVIYGEFTEKEMAAFRNKGLDIEKPSLQDIFIYLTEKGGGRNA